MMPEQPHITIIGAGFSGTLTAFHTLHTSAHARVTLIERTGRFGPGLAYSTPAATHYLNVPAGNMSAFPDDPSHFLRWASARDSSVGGGSFLPRGVYGEYLRHLLAQCERDCGPRLSLVHDRPVALSIEPHTGCVVTLANGQSVRSDRVVLACGNSEPAHPAAADAAVRAHPGYIRNPWESEAISHTLPDEPVLILGTGLTMMDVVTSLQARDHAGRIIAISRHGLLPRPHRSPSRAPAHRDAPPPLRPGGNWDGTTRSLLKILRQAVRDNAGRGTDWRDVITSIRSQTPAIWQRLSPQERARFLERLRSYWDVIRHRAAPETAAIVADMLAARQLVVRAGRLTEMRPSGKLLEVCFRPRGSQNVQTVRVAKVINCMGPDADIRRIDDPFIASALAAGLIAPDRHALGVEVAEDGRAIRADGTPHDRLHVVGPLRRGQYWENTAVPELKIQALQTAIKVLEPLSSVTSSN